jgi:hypothetical protein
MINSQPYFPALSKPEKAIKALCGAVLARGSFWPTGPQVNNHSRLKQKARRANHNGCRTYAHK